MDEPPNSSPAVGLDPSDGPFVAADEKKLEPPPAGPHVNWLFVDLNSYFASVAIPRSCQAGWPSRNPCKNEGLTAIARVPVERRSNSWREQEQHGFCRVSRPVSARLPAQRIAPGQGQQRHAHGRHLLDQVIGLCRRKVCPFPAGSRGCAY